MQRVSAAALIDAWEHGLGAHPLGRVMALLRLVEPDTPVEALADLPLGERDGRLLRLRERIVGPRFEAVATCPSCQEPLDLVFTATDVRGDAPSPPATIDVGVDGYSVRVRVPTTADVLAVLEEGVDDVARLRLLGRCVVSAVRPDGGTADGHGLPPHVTERVEAALADADPLTAAHLSVSCPSCAHQWALAFDIVRYLWEEVAARAEALLRETHAIATVYGWSEREIHAMSDVRRRAYLDLIESA